MKRYLVVVHNWFMDSKGWDVHKIEALNKEEAYKEGLLIKDAKESTFNKRAVKVIALDKEDVTTIVTRPSLFTRLIKRVQ